MGMLPAFGKTDIDACSLHFEVIDLSHMSFLVCSKLLGVFAGDNRNSQTPSQEQPSRRNVVIMRSPGHEHFWLNGGQLELFRHEGFLNPVQS